MGNYRGTVNGSVQTGYFDQPLEAFPGQIVSPNDLNLIDGYPVNEANGVFAGRGVVGSTALTIPSNDYGNIPAPFSIRRPASGDLLADFVGVAVRDSAMPNNDDGVPVWEDDRMSSILRKGRIFVHTNIAVSARDDVYMYIQHTDATLVGSFRNAAHTDTGIATIDLSTIARFWKQAPSGVAAIEILTGQFGNV